MISDHMRSDKGEHCCQCAVCQKIFLQPDDLTRHMKIHGIMRHSSQGEKLSSVKPEVHDTDKMAPSSPSLADTLTRDMNLHIEKNSAQ